LAKDKSVKGYMDNLKLELGKYHTLILPEYQPNPNIEVFSLKEFGTRKTRIVELEGSMNKSSELVEEFIKIRTHSLCIKSSDRAKFIMNAINCDLFNLKIGPSLLETLVKNSGIRGQTVPIFPSEKINNFRWHWP
jgi:hypothetical protein